MRSPRARCGECGRSRLEDLTVLVAGRRSGNYRRSSSRQLRRLCVDCVTCRVDYVRQAQNDRMQVPLDDHYFSWSQAAAYFDIDTSDLWRNDVERRRMEEQL